MLKKTAGVGQRFSGAWHGGRPSIQPCCRLWSGCVCIGLTGCGMPQPPEPTDTTAEASEAVELLGGPAGTIVELAAADASAVSSPLPARRPGWGTMAPIPNPENEQLQAQSAPYRLIGPRAPESQFADAGGKQAERTKPQRLTRWRIIETVSARSPGSKCRVHHLILPVADRR